MFLIQQYPEIVSPIIIFLLAFFVSLHSTSLARKLSIRLRVLDHPNARKLQVAPVPSLGGLAIVLATMVALLSAYGHSLKLHAILYVGMGIAVVGALDDVFSVRAPVKLFALATGCLVLFLSGIGLNRTPYPLINYVMTFLWVAGVSSAFNAIDNADGLAASVCLISATFLFALGWSTWQMRFSFLAMALAGSVLGFLHHNMKPARIYMGDSGSFFLGYILAVLVIYGEWSESSMQSLAAGCFVLALPIYDLLLTTVLRVRHGVVKNLAQAISWSDTDHLSHRLLNMNMSHERMLGLLCLIHFGCCATGYAIVNVSAHTSLLLSILAIASLLVFGICIDQRTSTSGLWVMDSDDKDVGADNEDEVEEEVHA